MQEEIIKLVQLTGWTQAGKEKFRLFLPLFGNNFLVFLKRELQKPGFDFTEQGLLSAMSACSLAEKSLQSGDARFFKNILSYAPLLGLWNNGQYMLSWVLDLKSKLKNFRALNYEEASSIIYDFYYSVIDYLPDTEIINLLENYVAGEISRSTIPVLDSLKYYFYRKHWDNDSDKLKPFLDALLRNNEPLLSRPIILEGKSVEPAVKNIIKDFIFSQPSSASVQKTAYDITKYFISSNNIQGISAQEKDLILEILKIYLWLQRPALSEDEIAQIISNRNNNLQAKQDDIIRSENIELPDYLFYSQEETRSIEKSVDLAVPVNIKNISTSKPSSNSKINSSNELFNAGIRLGNQAVSAANLYKPPVDIDKKLAELSKKINQK